MKDSTVYVYCKSIAALALAIALITTPIIVNHQLTELRKDAVVEIETSRNSVLATVDDKFDQLQNTVLQIGDKADKRLASIEYLADNRLGSLQRETLAEVANSSDQLMNKVDTLTNVVDRQLTVTNVSVAKLSDVYSVLPDQIGSRFEKQTNCTLNDLCWQNMGTALLRDARFTAVDVSRVSKQFEVGFPQFQTNTEKLSLNLAGIAENVNKITKPHWYDRLLNLGIGGLLVASKL